MVKHSADDWPMFKNVALALSNGLQMKLVKAELFPDQEI